MIVRSASLPSFALAAALGLGWLAAPASAAVMSLTFSGTITSTIGATNTLGLDGAASAAMGDQLTISYIYDTAAIIPNGFNGGDSINNLTVTVTDVTTGGSAVFIDSHDSYFHVASGSFFMGATAGSSISPPRVSASIDFFDTSLADGGFDQLPIIDPLAGSFGSLDFYVNEGTSASIGFSVDSPIPEPMSIAILGTALLGVAGLRRRR